MRTQFEPRPQAETGRAPRDQSLPIRHSAVRRLKPLGGMRTQFEPSEARRVAAATNPSPSAST
jgi:hypothetical protein